MKSYLNYKNQLSGLNEVLVTVQATEKIAASEVHNLEKRVEVLKLYTQHLEKALYRLHLLYPQLENNPYLKSNNQGKRILVSIFGDKGLVGGLWHNMVDLIQNLKASYDEIVVFGLKGKEYLLEEKVQITRTFINTEAMVEYLFFRYKNKELSRVDLIYPAFVSLSHQLPKLGKILPFTFINEDDSPILDEGIPLFTPSKKSVADFLLERYITSFLLKIVLETKLSELSARTVSSEHAQAKTKEVIKQIKKEYLKDRKKVLTLRQLESFLNHQII